MKSCHHVPRCKRLYIGMDIGGTNIQASLVHESGLVICRVKLPTPRPASAAEIIEIIENAIRQVAQSGGAELKDLTAIGIAVPGVVDIDKGLIVVTANMSLDGVFLRKCLEEKFGVPIALDNDGNLGALGETWLGAARKSKSTLYICVGTGIGSGLVFRGKLWRGNREGAGEIGHTVMQLDGPKCSCGNLGCLEALAGRTAIERDVRAAVAAGRKTILTDLTGGDLSIIRSGMIRKALDAKDELTREIVGRAAEVLGQACLNARHLIDPETIVLGGGVMAACGDLILPIVEQIVVGDPLLGARSGGNILISALGDDAVILGAVAAARKLVGRNPLKKRFRVKPRYPTIESYSGGQITVANKTYNCDMYISVNGRPKKRETPTTKEIASPPGKIGSKELEIICRGGPAVLFIGADKPSNLELTEEARRFLSQRSIGLKILPTEKMVRRYNKSKQRKAALFCLIC
ncbi:MAG: ROK family protein [Thermoguttaceae bacterium]